MDSIQILERDLEKGYSKSDLERLVGLPKNSLSGILKGSKNLSKKSVLKIQAWEKSEKPDPLNLQWKEIQTTIAENNLPENKEKILEEKNRLPKEQYNSKHPATPNECTEYPSDFQSLLKIAKEGVDNEEAFKMAVSASKLAPNQKSMVLAKLKSN